MIWALLLRRFWLWKNRLLPSIIFIFIFPSILFLIIYGSTSNIFITSLSLIPFSKWLIPGFFFIIGSISILPLLLRDFFVLRIDRKMLTHISMAPYSKRKIILSYLAISIIEAFVIIFIFSLIISFFFDFDYLLLEYLIIFFQLSIYLFILGNIIISFSLLIDSVTLYTSLLLYLFAIIFFGNGFIIELGLFSQKLNYILSWQPLSIPFQVLQSFLTKNIIDWNKVTILLLLSLLLVITNSILLRKKLKQ